MNLEQFLASLSAARCPQSLSPALWALWTEAHGDWHTAHGKVQTDGGVDAAWVHAYLHRREGDLGNAAYWYARAGEPVCRDDLDTEWQAIVASLLA